jgi:predicted esterase
MFNQLARQLSLAITMALVASLTALMMGPLNAKLVEQSSYPPPSICTGNEIHCKQESNGTVVLLPLSYDDKKTYPALLILPATYNTPANYIEGDFANQYKTRTENPFIVILLPVTGLQSDWDPGENFGPAKERYERLVKGNLDLLRPKYNLNSIVVAGSSLGGDLSWSLSLRNPDLFQGAIVINSMSLERIPSNMAKISTNKSRFVLISSEVDEKKRLSCMRKTARELASNGVVHWFGIVPGKDFSSESLKTEMLMPSIDYVLFGKNLDGRSWDNHKNLSDSTPDGKPENRKEGPTDCP